MMKWADTAEERHRALLPRQSPAERERDMRIGQLANHMAMLDDSPTTTEHWDRAREIIRHSLPLPGGLVSIPRDWCIVRFETDPTTHASRITPLLFMSRRQCREYIQTWYAEAEEAQ